LNFIRESDFLVTPDPVQDEVLYLVHGSQERQRQRQRAMSGSEKREEWGTLLIIQG